jgi:hypothetical protein
VGGDGGGGHDEDAHLEQMHGCPATALDQLPDGMLRQLPSPVPCALRQKQEINRYPKVNGGLFRNELRIAYQLAVEALPLQTT